MESGSLCPAYLLKSINRGERDGMEAGRHGELRGRSTGAGDTRRPVQKTEAAVRMNPYFRNLGNRFSQPNRTPHLARFRPVPGFSQETFVIGKGGIG